MEDCLFCKIAAGQIPVEKLYEDDDMVAFWDIEPHAPKHFLVVPRRHIVNPSAMTAEDDALVGKLLRVAGLIAAEQGVGDGFRAVINNGFESGQRIFHIHVHIMGGRPMGWPPG
ncbi:MAG: histidine triad nucleotide-binding protein [Desulfocapsaceae bacterium]|nr:histidine triad nucleotide-binding protein [Desulfocapsaceae bacterium]